MREMAVAVRAGVCEEGLARSFHRDTRSGMRALAERGGRPFELSVQAERKRPPV